MNAAENNVISEPHSVHHPPQEESDSRPFTPASYLMNLSPEFDASTEHRQICLKCRPEARKWSETSRTACSCEKNAPSGPTTPWDERNMRCTGVEESLFKKQDRFRHDPRELKECILQLTSHVKSEPHLNGYCNCGKNELEELKELSRSIAATYYRDPVHGENGELTILGDGTGELQWVPSRPISPSDDANPQTGDGNQFIPEEGVLRTSTKEKDEATKGWIWTYDPIQGVYRSTWSRDMD